MICIDKAVKIQINDCYIHDAQRQDNIYSANTEEGELIRDVIVRYVKAHL